MRAPSMSQGRAEGEAVPACDAKCRARAPEEGTLEHAAIEAPGKCPKQQAWGSRSGTCAHRDPRLPTPRPSEPHLPAPTCTCEGIGAKESQPHLGTAPNYAEPGNQCLRGGRCVGWEGFLEAGSSLQVEQASWGRVQGELSAGGDGERSEDGIHKPACAKAPGR